MADAVKTKKKTVQAGGKRRRGHMPTKTEINLAIVGEEHINGLIALPAILLIILAATLFSKFLVIDRLREVSAAQAEVAALQRQLDAGYEELADYSELANLYAHYTFSGMTKEEQERIDRSEILDLLGRVVFPNAKIDSLSLSGNQMTLNMTSNTLQEINLLVQKLEDEPLVDFCSVSTAVSSEYDDRYYNYNYVEYDENVVVSARVIIYFKSASEVAAG